MTAIANHHRREGRFDRPLVPVVDGCLAGCIFVLPFLVRRAASGGSAAAGRARRQPPRVGMGLRQALKPSPTWRWSGAEPLLAAGVALSCCN